MSEGAPGPLIASGRSADVYDIGGGRVLRRYRTDHDVAGEAALMAHVAEHGYPVPVVRDADGRDLVMDRVAGPTMLGRLVARPWELRGHARVLATLQQQLGDIPLGGLDLVERAGGGPVIVHGDHHPDNVILSPAGPVVIDWTGAYRGPVGAETATTWCLLHAADAPVGRTVVAAGRRLLTRYFLAASDRPAAIRALPAVVDLRLGDQNLSPVEKQRMVDLVRRERTG
jgi:aminoglycoside phosphotransferase (APT) family kinase protein